jgi:hypothetical protein
MRIISISLYYSNSFLSHHVRLSANSYTKVSNVIDNVIMCGRLCMKDIKALSNFLYSINKYYQHRNWLRTLLCDMHKRFSYTNR